MARSDTGWTAVSGAILRGLAHEMNNRLLALTGLRELSEDGIDPELLSLFDGELLRLEASVALLRRLGETAGEPELVEAGALLAGVRELHRRNALLRGTSTEWEIAEGLPAVHVRAVAAERALLQALSSCGAAARDRTGALTVTASAGDGAVVLAVSPGPDDPSCLAALEEAGLEHERASEALRVRLVTE